MTSASRLSRNNNNNNTNTNSSDDDDDSDNDGEDDDADNKQLLDEVGSEAVNPHQVLNYSGYHQLL